MELRRPLLAAAGAAALLAGLAVTAPADAAVPSVPLTCGTVVQEDLNPYLPADRTCPTFGLRVTQDRSADVLVTATWWSTCGAVIARRPGARASTRSA